MGYGQGDPRNRIEVDATDTETAAVEERFWCSFSSASMGKVRSMGLLYPAGSSWLLTDEGKRVAAALRNDWACKADMPRTIKISL